VSPRIAVDAVTWDRRDNHWQWAQVPIQGLVRLCGRLAPATTDGETEA